MLSYKGLVDSVLTAGIERRNRTGINAISTFGNYWFHDMEQGLPILTTKKINIKACIHELLWFLKGDTNIKYLNDNDIHIWDPWADKNGDLGPIYGKQWTYSGPKHINQVQYVIDEIRNNPLSRRIIIDGWNPSDLEDMALPPCHILYQFYAEPEDKRLSLIVYMRSADIFLGVPFDIAEGGLLLSLIAKITGYKPHFLTYFFGDAHIYTNHVKQLGIQMERECLPLPTLELSYKKCIEDYTFEDFNIINYKHHGALKGDIAV